MADTYPNFAALEQHERSGIDYAVLVRREEPAFAIVAPHGGGIEPGTSEIADAIAVQRWSFYSFEGLKQAGNRVLHITSACFDEPMCLVLLSDTNRVVTIHGEESDDDSQGVFVGGLDLELGARMKSLLKAQGFDVRTHPDPNLQGLDPKNICNRGTTGKGVQLELSGGYEYDYRNRWLTLVPSVQAATHDFFGATIYAEAGVRVFAIGGMGRTNLNPYWNLGFDPNDYVQFGAGYRDASGNTISAYAIHDDRLDTGQTNTHLTIRRYLPHEWRLTVDTVYEQGRGDDDIELKSWAVSVDVDWRRWFVRVAEDPHVNYTPDRQLRFAGGLRF